MRGRTPRILIATVTAGALLAAGTVAANADVVTGADAPPAAAPAAPAVPVDAGPAQAEPAELTAAQERMAARFKALPVGKTMKVGESEGRAVTVTKQVTGEMTVKLGGSGQVSTLATECVDALSIALIGLGAAAAGALLVANPAAFFSVAGFTISRGTLAAFSAAGGLTSAILSTINAICAKLESRNG